MLCGYEKNKTKTEHAQPSGDNPGRGLPSARAPIGSAAIDLSARRDNKCKLYANALSFVA